MARTLSHPFMHRGRVDFERSSDRGTWDPSSRATGLGMLLIVVGIVLALLGVWPGAVLAIAGIPLYIHGSARIDEEV